ncbi:hypothetical protein NEOLEDRAFT_1177010 [Neolentinus lepideus HHB14362 ss-1]|uniref:Uncharacterized protein n=1 Tax=Neolentinus lepideus HHB14362 ss-1 TaxID=1314782 RepID=A0A165TVH9_9AGAM|nr:hypothetical protein NEOLEDRAFT_1177010 [Neolentinus lepideus HHB14362 ss-1]
MRFVTEGMDALRQLISEEISDLAKELSMDEGDAVEEVIRQETQRVKRELKMVSPSPKSVSPHLQGG